MEVSEIEALKRIFGLRRENGSRRMQTIAQ
jgi:hypothetical protein